MKFIIAFAFFVAGISALPQAEDAAMTTERLVTGPIVQAIDDVSQSIKDAGLDPFIIKREARSYALPVPVIFNAVAFVEDVLSVGLSDIRVNRMSFSALTFRLNFDLELPQIHFSIGDSYGEMTVFDNKLDAEVSGSVDINSIRVVGRAQVRVGIISGVSVRDLRIDFSLRSIDSQLNIRIQNYDLTDFVNTFLGATIPNTLQSFSSEINQLIEIVLLDLIEENLS